MKDQVQRVASVVLVGSVYFLFCDTCTAQGRFVVPQQPQVPPPEAWRNMDQHRTIDPRILEYQRQAEEQAKKQRLFDQAKARHRARLQGQLAASRTQLGAGGAAALEDASYYFALAEIEGRAPATTWLNQRVGSIEADIERLERQTLPTATAHDTLIAGAALAGGGKGGGRMVEQTRLLISTAQQHAQNLKALTGFGYQAPRFMPGR